MKTIQATPGPWYAEDGSITTIIRTRALLIKKSKRSAGVESTTASTGSTICYIPKSISRIPEEQHKANVNLITSALFMREALERVEIEMRSFANSKNCDVNHFEREYPHQHAAWKAAREAIAMADSGVL